MKRFLFCASVVFCSFQVMGQSGRGLIQGDTGIMITKTRIELSDARRIPTEPIIETPQTSAPELSYNLSLKSAQIPNLVNIDKAEKMAKEKPGSLYHNYVKLGYGNNLSALADVFINMPGKSGLLTFTYQHLSANGPGLMDFNKNNAGVSGKKFFKKGTLEADLHYKRRGNYFYGYNPETFIPTHTDSLQQVFQDIGGKVYWSGVQKSKNKSSYRFGADFYHFADKWKQQENRLLIDGQYQTKVKKNELTIQGAYRFQQFKADSSGFDRHIVDIQPTYSIRKKDWNLHLGFVSTIVSQEGSDVLFKFFPTVEGNYIIQPNELSVFGKISGSVDKNNFRDFAYRNPFLSYNPNLDLTVNQFIFDAGIRGRLTGNTGFVVQMQYKRSTNAVLFVVDSNEFRSFRILHDDMDIVKVSGEINHQYGEKFRAALRVNYNHYTPMVQAHAWHLPKYEANLNLTYNLGNKILLSMDAFVIGDRKTYSYQNNTMHIHPIKAIGDFNLGVDYRWKKQISGFLKLNNLLGQHYQMWYTHPMYSFNLHGGVAIGF